MRSTRLVLVGVVAMLVSCGGGSSSTSTDAGAEVAYNVGDTGPGGGIIVYVDESGFDYSGDDNESIGAICPTESCQYIEMAPTDLDRQYSWDDAIAAAEAFSTPSAYDWVLPSKDALNEVCKYAFGDTVNAICNDSGNGAFSNRDGSFVSVKHYHSVYWNSSESTGDGAWAQSFGYGNQGRNPQILKHHVRPVRAF